jgi:Skp family chaperone for outer membrane proteins
MRHWSVCCALAAAMAGVIGCGNSTDKGGLAVVDLDEVARAVGANAQLNDMVNMKKASLNNAIVKADTELKSQLESLIEEAKSEFPEEFPKNVPADEAKKLQQSSANANAQRQMIRNKAQAELQNFENQLRVQFRSVVRPIAQEIAAKKGFSIVIPKNDALLLSVAPGNDITSEVILAVQAHTQKTALEAKTKATEAKPEAEKPETEAAAKPAKKEKKTAAAPRSEKKTKEITE